MDAWVWAVQMDNGYGWTTVQVCTTSLEAERAKFMAAFGARGCRLRVMAFESEMKAWAAR